jgi:hypothetical protein
VAQFARIGRIARRPLRNPEPERAVAVAVAAAGKTKLPEKVPKLLVRTPLRSLAA